MEYYRCNVAIVGSLLAEYYRCNVAIVGSLLAEISSGGVL